MVQVVSDFSLAGQTMNDLQQCAHFFDYREEIEQAKEHGLHYNDP